MKVLTATTLTQGQRASDFAWCIPGEIVSPAGFTCDTDRDSGDPDTGCGCGRSFYGLNSRKATTTAMVKDIDGYTIGDLTEALRSSRQQAGFASGDGSGDARLAEDQALLIAETAAEYDDGDVLEVRHGEVTRR